MPCLHPTRVCSTGAMHSDPTRSQAGQQHCLVALQASRQILHVQLSPDLHIPTWQMGAVKAAPRQAANLCLYAWVLGEALAAREVLQREPPLDLQPSLLQLLLVLCHLQAP